MPKFFVISDVHGYYDEMIEALNEAGFDPQNENHWLITCGDHFDRGSQPLRVMSYLYSLPRKILVKGNHEELLMECVHRQYPMSHDWHNGTAQTIVDLAPRAQTFEEACKHTKVLVKDFLAEMVDYAELKNHIFVHSSIPCGHDWRHSSAQSWSDARWVNPYQWAHKGLLPDKILVFGHYHTSWAHHHYEGKPEWGEDADFSIYRGDGYIAIDACCAYSGKINCLVIEDDFMGVEV